MMYFLLNSTIDTFKNLNCLLYRCIHILIKLEGYRHGYHPSSKKILNNTQKNCSCTYNKLLVYISIFNDITRISSCNKRQICLCLVRKSYEKGNRTTLYQYFIYFSFFNNDNSNNLLSYFCWWSFICIKKKSHKNFWIYSIPQVTQQCSNLLM
jgi:hypothetical protein